MRPSKRILVVDDEEPARCLLEAILESIGHQSVLATAGQEALEKLDSTIDLVLLDIMLPDMDGFGVAQQIRNRADCEGIPIVMVTALSGKEDRIKAINAGANDFISKPIEKTELQVRLASLLKMKDAQDALRRSEVKYRTLVETVQDPIWTADLDLRYTYVSPSINKTLGYTVDEIMSMHPFDGLTPPSRESVIRAFNEELALEASTPGKGHVSWTEEIEQYHKDGSARWAEITMSFLRDNNGKPLGIMGISHDITERKQMDEALRKASDELEQRVEERTGELLRANARLQEEVRERKRAENALGASEERYRTLFEKARDAIMILGIEGDEVGHIIAANRVAAEMHGYEHEELLGLRIDDLDTPESAEKMPQRMERLLKGEWVREEVTHHRKDGSIFPIEISAGLVELENHKYCLAIERDATDRKRAEQALRESEEKYRDLFDNSTDIIYTQDSRGRFTSVNRASDMLLGYTSEELVGLDFRQIVDPAYLSLAEESFDRKVEKGAERTGPLEFLVRTKNGHPLWLEVNSRVVFRDGEQVGLHGTARDITERKRTEAERLLLVTAIEQAGDAILVTDPNGTISYVNPAFERTAGYTRQDAVGSNPRMLQSGKQDEDFYRDLWETIGSGKTWSGSFVNKRKDGALYEEEATISPVKDSMGKIVNYVAVKRDVTEQREAERALRRSEELLRLVFQNMNSGLLVLNSRHEIALVNDYARSCLAVNDDELGASLLTVFPEAQALTTDASRWEQRQMILTNVRGSRKIIGFNSTTTPEEDLRIILFRDITLLLENDKRRKRAEQLAVVGELAAKLSHEIKNPLASIFLGLQRMRRAHNLSEDNQFMLDLILEEVERLSDSIKHVLEAARLLELSPSVMPLEEFLTSCFRIHNLAAGNMGIHLELAEGASDAFVIADEMALRSVMTNLIQNSMDACVNGDKIRIGWRLIGDQERQRLAPEFSGSIVGIFVEDTGHGIPEDVTASDLFRPFYTTKEGGTGLGLAVVNELVEQHGGTVRVDRQGEVTVFEVLLPTGHQVRCWESPGTKWCSNSGEQTDCVPCEVRTQEAGLHCWSIKGRVVYAETGHWRKDCLNCPVFRATNLSYSIRKDTTSVEE